MSRTIAAVGIKPHTGWAAYVVVAMQPGTLGVLRRARVELLPEDGSIPRQMYHDAANLSEAAAGVLIESAKQAAGNLSQRWLNALIDELQQEHVTISACAVLTSNSALQTPQLEAILQSHPLIHAAEGRLFQDACVEACLARDIPAMRIPEREVWSAASNTMRSSARALQQQIDGLRKVVGPPWGSDQKHAAAAATAALGACNTGNAPRTGRGRILRVVR